MTKQNLSPEQKPASPVILIVALLLFGLLFGGFGLYNYNVGMKSASWPAAQGKIISSRVESTRKDQETNFRASVRYRYSIQGVSYIGTRITASDVLHRNRGSAEDILGNYPVAKDVKVYYDPAQPATSVLKVGLPKNVYILLATTLGCLFLAAAITISMLKKRKQP
jgi:hypothetical protein